MSKSSSLSRNKMTTTPVVGKRSTAASVLAGTSKTSKLRTELRRVMSDRVLKITRCSQQQNVKQKDNNVAPGLPQNRMSLSQTHKEQVKIKTVVSSSQQHPKNLSTSVLDAPQPQEIPIPKFIPKETSPKLLAKLTGNTTTEISPNSKLSGQKISLQPIKTFDLKDKKSLIDHIITAYNDVVSSQGSIILAVQSIINSITHYIKANQLDLKSTAEEILKENLLKSNIELKQKYPNDELSEKLKLESQLQVLLQIENYIILNQNSNSTKIKVDDDWVWDIANQIRCLKQKFKDFKIERFLFGEIYANYYLTAADFICSLMEELGYDKEDNGNESSSSSETEATPTKNLNESNDAAKLKNPSNSAKFLSQLSQGQSNTQLGGLLKEESNSSFSVVGGVNSLFEEESSDRFNDCGDPNDFEESSQNPTNEKADILDEFIKKKPARKSEVVQSSLRSIVIQKKRTRLKIRSPFKSPSKGFQNKRSESRKSPRLKDKQIIQPDIGGQKRPRTYLITDTPDHKQNSTIITTRQEKLRKRFSFQQFTSAAASLPSVPDTPVKEEIIEPATTIGSRSLFPFQKIYPSPSKAFLSPQKTPQKIYGSPLKVYATPSPTRKYAPSPSAHAFASPRNFVSPSKRSPAKRVIFR